MRVITIARKPLQGSSVAENVTRYGTGGLNIDACRIQISSSDPNQRPGVNETTTPSLSMFGNNSRRRGHLGDGRWPANVILEHRSECRQIGTKKVKGSLLDQVIRRTNSPGLGNLSNSADSHCKGYTDKNGFEEVPAWECPPDCPVKALDEQSGLDRGAFAPVWGTEPSGAVKSVYGGGRGRIPGVFHGDTGGASRFFKQVKGGDDANQE